MKPKRLHPGAEARDLRTAGPARSVADIDFDLALQPASAVNIGRARSPSTEPHFHLVFRKAGAGAPAAGMP
jgi:hypothetical protein